MDSEFIASTPEPGAVSTSGDPFETIEVDIDAFEQVLEAHIICLGVIPGGVEARVLGRAGL